MTRSDPEAVFSRLRGLNPYPKTELHYESAFQLLIAVILSAQATDLSVNRATKTLFEVAATPKRMADLGVSGVTPHIKSIGLYRNKAKNIVLTAQKIHELGEVPRSRTALQALPGVGRKTANVILNTAFAYPTMAVDTHIYRLAHRLGWSQGKTPEAVEQDLYQIIPAAYLLDAHHWLILHGRYVCKAKQPKCDICPIHTWCTYAKKSDLVKK